MQSMECRREVHPRSKSRRALLLAPPRRLALRPIYGDGATSSDAAYVGITEHPRKGIDGDGRLSEAQRGHADDSRAFRSPRHGRGKGARERLELFFGYSS